MSFPKLHPHPRYNELRSWLQSHVALLRPWSGFLFRFQTVEFPTPQDVLNGFGARLRGGRWNPPGVATVYGSTTDTIALEECKAHDRYYGVITKTPRLLVTVEANLKRVLDLTDASTRRQLGVTLTELAAEDWRKLSESGQESFTQALGRALARVGASGLLARSTAVTRGINVVIYRTGRSATDQLSVVEGEKLQRLTIKTKT